VRGWLDELSIEHQQLQSSHELAVQSKTKQKWPSSAKLERMDCDSLQIWEKLKIHPIVDNASLLGVNLAD
jgi:hypothetical protein